MRENIRAPDLVRAVCNTTLVEQNQQEKERIMYTPSRNIVSCHLSGFAYHEGVQVFSDLKVGTTLELAAEPDNPYDNSAVSVSYQGKKLGYIPQAHNSILSKLLSFGHGDALEAQINRVTPDLAPERQIGIVVRIKDAR